MYALLASLPACLVNKNQLGMDYQINNLRSQSPIILPSRYGTRYQPLSFQAT